MRSLSSLGLALSLVFGLLLLALVAEVYYLLWWKKRIINRDIEDQEDDYSSPARELMYMFCLKKKPSSLSSHVHEPQAPFHAHPNKAFGEETLCDPPRFLFPIKEETREDLETDLEGSRSRSSFSDSFPNLETPFWTPLASPPYFTPPLSPNMDSSYTHQGFSFNPLFESSIEAEIGGIRVSPPTKLKFLKNAEEKIHRKGVMEEEDEENGSFITLIVGKKRESG